MHFLGTFSDSTARLLTTLSAWLLCLGWGASALSGDSVTVSQSLSGKGLSNVKSVDSSIMVDLKYSSADNFLKSDVYGDLNDCYLRPEAARMLKTAQEKLNASHPGYRLKVFDCARPRSVQWKMWNIVKGTASQKYVANPAGGSIHNYGVAVDLTATDASGKELDMGTPFDFFGDLAQPKLEDAFLKEGKLTAAQIANRKVLRKAMEAAGFIQLPSEWWHFDAFARDTVKQRYKIIE